MNNKLKTTTQLNRKENKTEIGDKIAVNKNNIPTAKRKRNLTKTIKLNIDFYKTVRKTFKIDHINNQKYK